MQNKKHSGTHSGQRGDAQLFGREFLNDLSAHLGRCRSCYVLGNPRPRRAQASKKKISSGIIESHRNRLSTRAGFFYAKSKICLEFLGNYAVQFHHQRVVATLTIKQAHVSCRRRQPRIGMDAVLVTSFPQLGKARNKQRPSVSTK